MVMLMFGLQTPTPTEYFSFLTLTKKSRAWSKRHIVRKIQNWISKTYHNQRKTTRRVRLKLLRKKRRKKKKKRMMRLIARVNLLKRRRLWSPL